MNDSSIAVLQTSDVETTLLRIKTFCNSRLKKCGDAIAVKRVVGCKIKTRESSRKSLMFLFDVTKNVKFEDSQ